MSCYLELSSNCGCSYIKKAAAHSPQAATVHRDYKKSFGLHCQMLPPAFPESARCCNFRRKRIKSPCTCAQTQSSLTDGKLDINTLSNFIFVCLNAVIFPFFVKHGAPLPEGLFTLTTANVAANNHPSYTNEIMLFKENLSLVFYFFYFFCACASTTAAV